MLVNNRLYKLPTNLRGNLKPWTNETMGIGIDHMYILAKRRKDTLILSSSCQSLNFSLQSKLSNAKIQGLIETPFICVGTNTNHPLTRAGNSIRTRFGLNLSNPSRTAPDFPSPFDWQGECQWNIFILVLSLAFEKYISRFRLNPCWRQ